MPQKPTPKKTRKIVLAAETIRTLARTEVREQPYAPTSMGCSTRPCGPTQTKHCIA